MRMVQEKMSSIGDMLGILDGSDDNGGYGE